MRIMINTLAASGAHAGGGYTVLSNLVPHLAQVDRDNEYVLVVSRKNRCAFETSAQNFRYVTLPSLVHRAPLRILVDNILVPRLASRYKVDVFFAPNDSLPPGLRCRSVVAALNLIYYHSKDLMHWDQASLMERCRLRIQRQYYRYKTPKAMLQADRVVALSQETRREVIASTHGILDKRVAVIYPGTPRPFLTCPNGHSTVRDNSRPPYILSTSAIVPYKNFDKLILAFAALQREHHIPHELVIIGQAPYPTYQLKLKDLAVQLGVGDKVDFRGFVPLDELIGFYHGAAVFVLLSSCESFGFPVLEAMACGTPVVVSNRSSLPEVVGDAGVTVDTEDVGTVSEVIGRILEDDVLRAELARRSRARAECFSWEKASLQLRRVFEEVYTSSREEIFLDSPERL